MAGYSKVSTRLFTVASRCSVALWTINQKCIDYNNSNFFEWEKYFLFNIYIDEVKQKITNEIESPLHSFLKLHHLTKKAVLRFPSPFLSFPFSYCEGFMVILQTKPSRIVQVHGQWTCDEGFFEKYSKIGRFGQRSNKS